MEQPCSASRCRTSPGAEYLRIRSSRTHRCLGVLVATALLCTLSLVSVSRAAEVPAASAVSATSPSTAADACRALVEHNFLDIPDAATHVNSATIVAATADTPEFCKAVGTIAPDVGFELDMPTSTWNGRLLMQGCGGSCGVVSTAGCQDVIARNYAIVQTDMGHRGKPISGWSWAENNRQGVIDFGYRATHVTIVAAKVIQQQFYGRAADHTYFRGCSTGGRQAMVEAQRFPEDFDGIIAVAPPLDENGDGALHLMWTARAATERSGRKIIDADDVRRVHAAVLAACDGLDGAVDGILQNPYACTWKVANLACKNGNSAAYDGKACLPDDKITAFQKIYAGAHNSKGRRIFAGGMPLGSELGWFPYFVAPDAGKAKVLDPNWLIVEQQRYLMFYDTQHFGTNVYDYDYDRDPARMGLTEPFFNAMNPDLQPFKSSGGKLILIHGWADPLIPPALITSYYETAMRTMGGPAKTQDFFRLFMVPGMEHCIGGDTADAIDLLGAIENWVEKGIAPDVLQSYHVSPPQTLLKAARFPLAAGQADWSRPLFPYPDYAVWNKRGDWKDPGTWVRKTGAVSGGP